MTNAPVSPEAAAHFQRGVALWKSGDLAGATTALKSAADLTADHPDILTTLGIVLAQAGRRDEAVTAFRQCLTVRPDHEPAFMALAGHLMLWSQWPAAEDACRQRLASHPGHGATLGMLGECLRRQERWPEAIDAYQQAVAAAPDRAETHHEFGKLMFELGRVPEAEALFRRAVTLRPGHPEYYTDLGRLVAERGDLDEALALQDRAVALDPRFAQGLLNRGDVQRRRLDNEGALASFRQAIAANPNLAEAHMNAALVLLSERHFAEGWREFNWRWRTIRYPSRLPQRFPQPEWDGKTPFDGKLLVWGEQGAGDEILYASMIPDLIQAGHPIAIECDQRLVPLFERSWPSATVIARSYPPNPATADATIGRQIAAGNLGAILRPDAASFPQQPRYLIADAERTAELRRELGKRGGPIVGVAWASKHIYFGKHKTASLASWSAIFDQPGVTFVDVQYGDTAAERAAAGFPLHHVPTLDLFNDLDGVAALLSVCDLVIAVSSTTAHLAAALGVPTWVLTPAGSGQLWPWFASGTDTPFYPSAQIYRQSTPGVWAPVIADVASALRQRFP